MRYLFDRWEDGSTDPNRSFMVTGDINLIAYYLPVTRRITVNSSPIAVTFTFNGQTLQPGDAVDVEDGATVAISVPAEVEA